MYSVMLRLDLSRSSDSDRSKVCSFLDIFDNQSVGRESFEIRFGCGPSSGRQVSGSMILILMLIETRMK